MNNFKSFFENICREHELIGANIIVTNKDNILEKASYGFSDTESQTLMNNDTIFRFASVSKVLIALGIMKLVEENKINLNDDISDILGFKIRNPKYPNIPITIKMVTTQTSSILDGPSDEADDIPMIGYNGVNGQAVDCTLKDLLYDKSSKYYTDLTFGDYKPGEKWNYSNFGCGILACIIEKITNIYYVDYINKVLFEPLNIDASFRIGYIKNKDNIGSLYNPNLRCRNKDHFLKYQSKIQPLGENYRGPAGGCFISNSDLSKITRLFLNKGSYNGKTLFKPETIELMYQQIWYGESNDDYVAKSVQMRIYEKLQSPVLRGHTGGAYGVHTFMFFNLKYNLGMCFICNGTYDKGFMRKRENLFLSLQNFLMPLSVHTYPHLWHQ